MTQRPTNIQKCGNERCGHTFAQHYTTYDGKKHGCSYYLDEQRDGGPCFCKGFAIVQAWTPNKAAPDLAPIEGGPWEGR